LCSPAITNQLLQQLIQPGHAAGAQNLQQQQQQQQQQNQQVAAVVATRSPVSMLIGSAAMSSAAGWCIITLQCLHGLLHSMQDVLRCSHSLQKQLQTTQWGFYQLGHKSS
jgi:hypothetical protein